MELKDFSWNESLGSRKNNKLLPKSIRGLIVGKSGCGKTTMLINLLIRPGWLDYDNLYIFGKSLFQPEYRILRKAFEEGLPKEAIVTFFENRDLVKRCGATASHILEQMAMNCDKKLDIKYNFFDSAEDVPDPRDLNCKNKNLMIFDDLLLERQNKCEAYYVRGRHNNVDCFYLAQNYFKLPRQTIRENANLMFIFPQDGKNVSHLYNDHVAPDMSLQEFKDFCQRCWSKPYGFVTIDLSSGREYGKYRCDFDEFYIPT